MDRTNTEVSKDFQLFEQLAQELLDAEEKQGTVSPVPAAELEQWVDLELKTEPAIESDFIAHLRNLVLSTPRTASNKFFNQLFGGRLSKAMLGELLAVLLNNSMYTYKVAGPQVGVEKKIISKLAEFCGYGDKGAGTIAPGGSMSNLMAMIMARDAADPQAKTEGISQKMTLYTSQNSHYSIAKNASFIGIGTSMIRFVPSHDNGSMQIQPLKEAIEKDIANGFKPFFVNATAGTTVLGAFDSITEISAVCKEYGLWLHVDGAYCGAVILSKKYRFLIQGVELSDSFSLNAHKMLGTPLTCSVFLTRHEKQLYDSFSMEAEYLYQADVDTYNLGKTSLQCGRRNDALKLFTLWKAVGSSGLEHIVDRQFELAEIAKKYVRSNPDYKDFSLDDSVSVCFNYKNIPAEKLCSALYEQAKLVVGYGTFKGNKFVRLVTVNSSNSAEDILEFFRILEEFSNKYLVQESN